MYQGPTTSAEEPNTPPEEQITPIEEVYDIVTTKGNYEGMMAEMTRLLHERYGLEVYRLKTISIVPSSSISGSANIPPDSQARGFVEVLQSYGIYGYEVPEAQISYPEKYLENLCTFYFKFTKGSGAEFGFTCTSIG